MQGFLSVERISTEKRELKQTSVIPERNKQSWVRGERGSKECSYCLPLEGEWKWKCKDHSPEKHKTRLRNPRLPLLFFKISCRHLVLVTIQRSVNIAMDFYLRQNVFTMEKRKANSEQQWLAGVFLCIYKICVYTFKYIFTKIVIHAI